MERGPATNGPDKRTAGRAGGTVPIIQQRDRKAVEARFSTELKRDVSLTLYTQSSAGGLFVPGRQCQYCGPTQELVEEVSDLSPRIHLEVVDFYQNRDDAVSRGVERIPALVIGNGQNGAARFFGMPSGFEFSLLLDSIIAASSRRSSLQLETRRRLKELEQDVHIKVFVTPTCQHSPTVARVAHAMALESRRVTADVVEVQEFPELSRSYGVIAVPKTVINDTVHFTGAVPEDVLLKRVLQAVGARDPDGDDADQVSYPSTPIP